ncbi:alkaline phosphatase [Bacillus pumilus]|uniref:phage tail spike protein n=2 Tax=Bacillus pumilus TaxID=1408 RepID=UPI00017A6B6B|nr:phage tail spike protein [Bacillus pumilus]EDW20796.1 mannosyl-glycoprotein endo-beta-N-acetylglucosaminidase [Bacillus pumilus ATCC 7061]MCR4353445.1 phage tail protein [Bacillus pumilus]MCY7505121.1 phage tail protein [Bacillus pumilus]MDR4269512.1 alkaline phosphatase [Bacillus pumilus]MED4725736.1 phage tail spike protein [Bacillus pumilus]
MAAADFIKKLAPGAQKVYKKYNVLASLVIAQGCLESGFGTSGLSKQANNLFGIKGTYNGKYVLMWTSEQDKKGNVTRIQAKFRKYPSYAESLADLGSLYTRLSRYKAVVGEKDYKKATAAVSKAGYATDIHYPSKLNSIIEKYNLTKYDGEIVPDVPDVPEEPSEPETPTKPTYPSKEYDGKDMPLNQHLPSDVDFPQLHVSSKDGKDVIEVTGMSVDFMADPTGKKTFSFTLPRTQENATEFELLVVDNILYLDEKKYNHQKYYITNVSLHQENGVLTKTVTAAHIFSVLLINNRIEKTVSKKLSIKEALDIALKGTDFKYVIHAKDGDIPSVEQENFGEKNSTELMDEIIEDYGIELDVDNYKIHVYKKMGQVIDFVLDSRYNMPGITITTDSQNCTTRAWGYGAQKETDSVSESKGDGKDQKEVKKDEEKEPEYVFEPVLYIHPDEDKFLVEGKPRWAEPIKDERYKKAGSIISALKKHVNPYPEMTVEVEFQKIYEPKLLEIEQDFWLGDTIHVIADTADGITFEDDLRVVSIQHNPLNPYSSPTITFANFRKDIQRISVDQAKQVKNLQRYINDMLKTLR